MNLSTYCDFQVLHRLHSGDVRLPWPVSGVTSVLFSTHEMGQSHGSLCPLQLACQI